MIKLFFDDVYLNYRANQLRIDLDILSLDERSLERFEKILDEELKEE
jgi:hypothetical protein